MIASTKQLVIVLNRCVNQTEVYHSIELFSVGHNGHNLITTLFVGNEQECKGKLAYWLRKCARHNENYAKLFEALLKTCKTQEEFISMFIIARKECVSTDLTITNTGRVWLVFKDESSCFIKLPKLVRNSLKETNSIFSLVEGC